jgi:Sec-independent protein translocase protein TatA
MNQQEFNIGSQLKEAMKGFETAMNEANKILAGVDKKKLAEAMKNPKVAEALQQMRDQTESVKKQYENINL